MPIASAYVPPPIVELLEPYGYADISEWHIQGRYLIVRMFLRCEQPVATRAELRAYFHGQAVEMLDGIEGNGWIVCESDLTIKHGPKHLGHAEMRLELLEDAEKE